MYRLITEDPNGLKMEIEAGTLEKFSTLVRLAAEMFTVNSYPSSIVTVVDVANEVDCKGVIHE